MATNVSDQEYDLIFFGGSFDPPHAGHLAIIEACSRKTKRLLIVPAALSPLKETKPVTFADRKNMIEALIATSKSIQSEFEISDLEAFSEGPSYTYLSLARLRKTYPNRKIALVVGADAGSDFSRWKNLEEIVQNHPIILFSRIGSAHGIEKALEIVRALGQEPTVATERIPDCSSSGIRSIIADAGTDLLKKTDAFLNLSHQLKDCLPAGLLNIIRERGLYRKHG